MTARSLAIRLSFVLSLTSLVALAQAGDATPEATFSASVTAIERGAWDEAIDQLELLADQGYSHPDASFNRALAYVERARTPAAKPGDLGRAAAALAETLELRPGDEEAEAALERVHAEIARRRARQDAQSISVNPSIARALTALAPESVWAFGALFGSLVLTVGLGLRFSERRRPRLAGNISAAVGGLILVVMGGLAYGTRVHRVGSDHAVVVVPDARLLDERGAPLSGGSARDPKAIPEGSSVYVLERRGTLARVEWGTLRAWLDSGQIRIVSRR